MQRDLLLKKTIYKSVHRGCKENDILIGDFAVSQLQDFSQDQLDLYVEFLEEDDLKIYNWLLKKEEFPAKYQNLILQIQKFHNL